jgi:Holliday junction DNA helicase RuvA
MIGKLKGIIELRTDDSLLLDVNGVCYLVFVSANTLSQLPGEGEAASVWIETHVREDHIHLFGFASQDEKRAFLLLNKVTGVGAKMALAILSAASPSQLATALAAQDTAIFRTASGVGPKLASRIVAELKDKFSLLVTDMIETHSFISSSSNSSALQQGPSLAINDAISALVNLGYNRSDAYTAVTRAASSSQQESDVGDLIRYGLKELGNA